jgi:hypothetical protein
MERKLEGDGAHMLSKLTAANSVIALHKAIAASILLCAALIWSSGASAQTALRLTSAGRAAIWKSLGKEATDAQVADGLQVGEKVPETLNVLPFTARIRKKVPAIKPYSYALLNGQVLIVDAQTRKIVAIVSK